MVKIIHTSDFHIGIGLPDFEVTQNLNELRFNDIIKNFDFIKNYAIKNNADFLIIAGDVFHNPRPSILAFNEFSRIIGELIKNDVKVIVVIGNHDTPKTREMLSYLKSFVNAGLERFYLFDKAEFKIIETKESKKIKFIGLPYPHFQLTLDHSSFIFKFEKKLKSLVNEKGNYDNLVAIGHFHVEGGKIGSEKRIENPIEYEIPSSIFNLEEIDLVCLGHLHTPQSVGEKIIYSGSIERIDFGEEREKKSFVEINLKDKIEIKRIPLRLRNMKTIPEKGEINILNEMIPEKKILEYLNKEKIEEESLIRLIIKLGKKQRKPSLKEIEKYLKEIKKVAFFKVIFERMEEEEKIKVIERKSFKEKLIAYIENKYKKMKSKEFVENLKSETFKIIQEIDLRKEE